MADHRAEYKQAITNIEELLNLPDRIRTFSIEALKPILDSKDVNLFIKNKIQNTVEALKNLNNDSLRANYRIIYNQCCVLAVSAVSATLEKYFVNYINTNLDKVDSKKLSNIRVTLEELAEDYDFNPRQYAGSIVLEKDNSITFQDLKSIKRVFKEYIGKEIELNEHIEKQIVFYFQCRHILVHKKGIADDTFIQNLNKFNANIKNYKIGEEIQLFIPDWINIKQSFSNLIESSIPHKPNDKSVIDF